MRIRAKLGSRRLVVDVTGSQDRVTVNDVIRCAATAFELESDAVGVSLNGEVFLGTDEGDLDVSSWGLVSGDLIYLENNNDGVNPQPMSLSNEPVSATDAELPSQASSSSEYYSLSNSSPSLNLELTGSFSYNLHGLVLTFEPQTPCQYLALVCHALFTEAGFLTPPDEMFNPCWSANTAVVRLSYNYKGPQIPAPDKAPVKITLMDCQNFVTASAQVVMDSGPSSYFSTALEVSNFVKTNHEDGQLRLINQNELVTRIRDDLLEKLRQDLHIYFGLMPVGLLRLPNELQFRVLRLLDCKSLCHMEQSCSLYRHLSRAIWRHLFKRDFNDEYERLKNAGVTDWKLVYQEHFERARALEEARRRSIERTETFIFNEDIPPELMPHPMAPFGPPLPPPGIPGMLGGAHDLWPLPLRPPRPFGPRMDPFRPWFRHPRP